MTASPKFELIPIERLRIHERIHPEAVGALVERIRRDGRIDRPLLVSAKGSVILDGHHRFAALQALGARLAPAWVVDYHWVEVELDRWQEGPALTKEEVIERAVEGRPFDPKTTRHRVRFALPPRSTPLAELLVATAVPPSHEPPR